MSALWQRTADRAPGARNGRPDSIATQLEEDRYRPAREVRRLFEQDWILQIAYYLGHQWVQVDASGRLFGAEIGDERVTLTDNRIRPAVRATIAKQTKSTPTWVGIPRGSSDEEVQRARLRTIVFEHYWRLLEGRRKLRLALWYRENTGAGFLKQTWDPTAGDSAHVMAVRGGPVLTDSYGGPITPDRVMSAVPEEVRGQLDLEQRTVTFGDGRLELVSPFELAVDPLATDEGLSTAEYVVQDGIYSPAYLARRFPGVDRDKLVEDANPTAGILESRFPVMSAYLNRQRENRGAAGRRGVRVREYWSRPGVDGPRGKHVVWTVDGTIISERDCDYPFLPYAMFSGPPSGRFWPDAPIKDAISPQTEKNKTISQIAENAERFGNPARLRSIESLDRETDWHGLPGEEIVYHDMGTPGSVPQFMTPPEMPQYVQNRIPQIDDSINSTLNQATVSQGEVPQGVTAASAINLLLEASNTVLGDDIKEALSGLLDVGKMLLWQVRHFAHDDRLASIAGEDSAYDVYSFTGEQLGDCESDEVDIGSEQTQSVAAKQAGIQFVLNLLIQNGQAPPPRELRRILRDYEVGGLEHFFASISHDQSQIIDEHRRMLRGEVVEINSYDDDSVHIEEHQDFQKQGRYRQLTLKPGGQRIQALIEAHVQAHRNRAQQAATQAATAAAAQEALASGNPGPDPNMISSDPTQGAGGGTPPGALPSQPSMPSGG